MTDMLTTFFTATEPYSTLISIYMLIGLLQMVSIMVLEWMDDEPIDPPWWLWLTLAFGWPIYFALAVAMLVRNVIAEMRQS